MHKIENNNSQLSQEICYHKPIYFTFPSAFLMIVLTLSIYLNGPNQINQLSYSCLQFPLYMHYDSSESYITYWVSFNSSPAPLNFLFPQPIPKALKT